MSPAASLLMCHLLLVLFWFGGIFASKEYDPCLDEYVQYTACSAYCRQSLTLAEAREQCKFYCPGCYRKIWPETNKANTTASTGQDNTTNPQPEVTGQATGENTTTRPNIDVPQEIEGQDDILDEPSEIPVVDGITDNITDFNWSGMPVTSEVTLPDNETTPPGILDNTTQAVVPSEIPIQEDVEDPDDGSFKEDPVEEDEEERDQPTNSTESAMPTTTTGNMKQVTETEKAGEDPADSSKEDQDEEKVKTTTDKISMGTTTGTTKRPNTVTVVIIVVVLLGIVGGVIVVVCCVPDSKHSYYSDKMETATKLLRKVSTCSLQIKVKDQDWIELEVLEAISEETSSNCSFENEQELRPEVILCIGSQELHSKDRNQENCGM